MKTNILVMIFCGTLAAGVAADGAANKPREEGTAVSALGIGMPTGTTNGLAVFNNGQCGQNSRILRDNFAADVLRHTPKPSYVLIYIGMNDVINDKFFTPLDKYIENMAWMVEEARTARITPVICSIHRVDESMVYAHHPREKFGVETVNAKRKRYNAALRKLASDRKVTLADFDAVTDSLADTNFLADGVHLTLAGNQLLAKTFLDVVSPQLRGKETIVCVGDSLTYGFGNKGAGSSEGETYPAMLQRIRLPAATEAAGKKRGTNQR